MWLADPLFRIVSITILKSFDLLFDLVFTAPISFLDFPGKLLALAVDLVEVIVRQIALLFFDLAFKLLPVCLKGVPVHGRLRSVNRL